MILDHQWRVNLQQYNEVDLPKQPVNPKGQFKGGDIADHSVVVEGGVEEGLSRGGGRGRCGGIG